MKYGKFFLIAICIYLVWFLLKIFVINSLFGKFSATGPIVELGFDGLWLMATIYAWHKVKKESEPNHSAEPSGKTTDENNTPIDAV